MRYTILHRTVYRYSERVSDSHHLARLAPVNCVSQLTDTFRLKVLPEPDLLTTRTDYFGNETTFFSITSPHTELSIESYSQIQLLEKVAPILSESRPWEEVRAVLRQSTLRSDIAAAEFSFESPLCPVNEELASYARPSFPEGRPLLEGVHDLMQRIFNEFRFDNSASNVTTAVMSTFEKRAGVCQDFAHLMISCLRSLGLAARYVSGYLRTDPPPGRPRLVGADASHAWVDVYDPDLGWQEFDATNNVIPHLDHIKTALGRDYHDICPIRGTVYGGGRQTLKIGVTVTPLDNA